MRRIIPSRFAGQTIYCLPSLRPYGVFIVEVPPDGYARRWHLVDEKSQLSLFETHAADANTAIKKLEEKFFLCQQ